ncbi:hypothetical protein ASPZODRAFT_20416 [Penicilliopsis zonata CBS 506.65]|uniref:PEBP-like protein n=1 Tax=Penicilliopsis zonata CBS 506.65 TaxID=1073090 RepID=A0A1L9S5L6_9EURO|nr:hypothetical protein ASPZODRAFT_20416 [Penicilliopsis zonata CBS 506.65]OJJ42445.1 hypothetical protein ASPZODRAFT_20416 [Penicilliopsis zonata CBS 506.65]
MYKSVALSLLWAAAALAQTPPQTWPVTETNLGAIYDENITVTPGLWIDPNDVGDEPVLYPTNDDAYEGKYMVFLIDWMIPDDDVTTSNLYRTLVPGLAVNTTTRLHWWAGNLTLDCDSGVFVNESAAIATYSSPRPRDSTNHTYALYLFDQPADYVLPEEAAEGLYTSQTTDDRYNFSMVPVFEAVGSPVAATYFLSNDA